MTIQHIKFNRSASPTAQKLDTALRQLDSARTNLAEAFQTMGMMFDSGTPTQYVLDQFGFLTTAIAQSAYDELNSLQSKLLSDGSVDHVDAACRQAIAKFG